MAPTIPAPTRRLKLEPLTPSAFAPFGAVIDNPQKYSENRPDLRFSLGNQGTSQRWFNISNLNNFYATAPSKSPPAPSISFAICAPRKLRRTKESIAKKIPDVGPDVGARPGQLDGLVYDVEILERHPFTPQTFIPVGLSTDDLSARYIVIVAPTLPVSESKAKARESPSAYPAVQDQATQESGSGKPSELRETLNAYPARQDDRVPRAEAGAMHTPKGRGLPDLDNIRVFLASGSQAVTYGPGTWHAPMAVIGTKPIEFIIVQNANGVPLEDCEEVELKGENGGEGVSVALDSLASSGMSRSRAKL